MNIREKEFKIHDSNRRSTKNIKNVEFQFKVVKRVTILMSLGAIVWTAGMFYVGAYELLIVPGGYLLLSSLSMYLCSRSIKSTAACNFQMFLSVLLPCIFQIVAGGAVESGSVMAWSMVPLFSVATYMRVRSIIKWSIYAFSLIILTVVIENLGFVNNVDLIKVAPLNLLLFNTFSTYLVVFYIGFFFIGTVERTRKNLKMAVQEVKDLNSELEVRNKEYIEGLVYARDIQDSFLKSEDHLRTIFTKLFLLREAKDYVSGDFIWAEQKNDYKFIIAGDCSSKGSSRGLLAMLMVSTADRILQESSFIDPGVFLTKFNESIRENSSLDLAEIKLDVTLTMLIVNAKTNEARLATAGGSMLVREGVTGRVKNYQVNRSGLGCENANSVFTSISIDLQLGDMVYLCTDGYTKQENSKGEPFGESRLKDIIKSLDIEYTFAQKHNLLKEFNQWQESQEQTDDVLICGFEIEDPALVYEQEDELKIYAHAR